MALTYNSMTPIAMRFLMLPAPLVRPLRIFIVPGALHTTTTLKSG